MMMSSLTEIAENQAELAKQTLQMANNMTMGWTAPLATISEYVMGQYVEAVKRFEQNLNSVKNSQ